MPAATETFTSAGKLSPRPPFDFAKTLAFFRMFTPMSDEQTLAGGTLTKAITLHGRAVAFTLRGSDSVETPQLSYTVTSEQPFGTGEIATMCDRITFFLSLEDDLQPFYTVARATTPSRRLSGVSMDCTSQSSPHPSRLPAGRS